MSLSTWGTSCSTAANHALRSERSSNGNALSASPASTLVVAGGVAANLYLRSRLEEVAAKYGARLVAPPVKLCTDNGAMIAWAGLERLRLGHIDALDFRPRPRWPLDPNASAAKGGVKSAA